MGELDSRVVAIAGVDRSQEHLDALRAELELPDDRFDGQVVDLLDEQAARDWEAHGGEANS